MILTSCGRNPNETVGTASDHSGNQIVLKIDDRFLDTIDVDLLSAMKSSYELKRDKSVGITKRDVHSANMAHGGSSWSLISIPSLSLTNELKSVACLVSRSGMHPSSGDHFFLDIWTKKESESWVVKLQEEVSLSRELVSFSTGYVEHQLIIDTDGVEAIIPVEVSPQWLKTNIGNNLCFFSMVSSNDSEPKSASPNFHFVGGKSPIDEPAPPKQCIWVSNPIPYRQIMETRNVVATAQTDRKWTQRINLIWRRYYGIKGDVD